MKRLLLAAVLVLAGSGACHGKMSFGFEDDCTMCHR